MIRQHNCLWPLFGMVAALALNLLIVQCSCAGRTKLPVSNFADIYEPSTVVALAEGWVLIAEDDGDEPLFLSQVVEQGSHLELEPVRLTEIDGALDDLEGSSLGKEGEVFLITSHSTSKKGQRKKKREVLTRLTFKDGKISEKANYGGIFLPLKEALEGESGIDAAALHQLNIEGLSFDSSKDKLLLGFRSPLAAGRAMIVVLENPYTLFTEGQVPRFQQEKIYLDIGGGGIRSMTYDLRRKVFLLANEIPNKKGKLRPALWAWNGKPHSPPTRVPLPKLGGIKNIEGMDFVRLNNKTFLLMVFDDGNRTKNIGGHYSFVDTSSLVY